MVYKQIQPNKNSRVKTTQNKRTVLVIGALNYYVTEMGNSCTRLPADYEIQVKTGMYIYCYVRHTN